MQNILILSCGAGQGHNSCAAALREAFEVRGAACSVEDSLEFIDEDLPELISRGHSFVYRHLPELFQWGYEYCGKHPMVFAPGSKVHKLLIAGADALREYIEGERFDAAVCTHVFPALMLTHLLREEPMPMRTAYISTDYTCHPGLDYCFMDHFFIPDERLRREFTAHLVPEDRITVTGIPVRREFRTGRDKKEAKVILGLSPEKRHLLVMCGSMGCGPMGEMVGRLVKNMTADMEATIICGTNRRLKRELERWYKGTDGLRIVGYTDQISLYMDASDLYLTKPGGISVTEAAAKALPMAFINAVAGCEQYNLEFFTELGGAVTARTPRELTDRCIQLLHTPGELDGMARALRTMPPPDSGEQVYQLLHREALVYA